MIFFLFHSEKKTPSDIYVLINDIHNEEKVLDEMNNLQACVLYFVN